MPPRRFDPSVMTFTEIHDTILNINKKRKELGVMRADTWAEWRNAVIRQENHNQIALLKKCQNIMKIDSKYSKRLHLARMEMHRRLNNEPTLRLYAQGLLDSEAEDA